MSSLFGIHTSEANQTSLHFTNGTSFPYLLLLAQLICRGKWPGYFSTCLCHFSSLELLTATVNQNSLGTEVEGQWSQDTGMQTFVLFCMVPLSNGSNTLNHNNRSSRVPNCKIPLNNTLLLSVHKKRQLFPPKMNSSIFERQNFHLVACRALA